MFAGQAIEFISEDMAHCGDARFRAARWQPDGDIRSQIPAIDSCRTPAHLKNWLLVFARSLGFYGARYIHLGTLLWTLEQAEMPLRFLTTSDRHEDEDRDWLLRDPSVERVRSAFAPFIWSTRFTEGLTDMQRLWFERERARGVAAGVAVPVQDSADGPAYLSLFGDDEEVVTGLIDRHAPELAFAAAQFHALAKTQLKVADWAPDLSEREIECLRLAALGKTGRESGKTLGLSNRTVEYHLRKASEKLGAATKTRAVVLAFGIGLAQG
ncbi:MAG TPA: LuxR C-terminal-related transcriptional regulator [Sphingobium sp.]|uniref:helix-turn-helix transcriptional regulator n=1 Tax=Sphingobium sp. TaxID=1912891 RepID=UPI002ED4E608